MSYFPAPIPQPVTATAGDFAVTAVGIVGVTQATSPWVTTSTISGISTVTGTVFATLAGTSVVAGIVSATQGTSPWIVAGTVSATQGTSPWVVSAAAIGATQSGVWAVNSTVTSIPGVGPTGTTAPTTAIVNGIIVSGTLQAVSSTFPMPVSLSGDQAVNIAQVAGATPTKTNGLFVVPGDNTNSITVKATSTASVAADTSLVVQINPEQPNLTTALNVQDVADGSVTAGSAASKSMLIGGVAATSAPSPTAGQQIAIQLDTSGNQRIVPYGNTGSATSVVVTQPAAGAAATLTVGAATKYVIQSVYFGLTTSSTVNNRNVVVEIKDASGNLVGIYTASCIQTASNTGTYTFAPGLTGNSTFVASSSGTNIAPIPGMVIGPSMQVIVSAFNLQGTDQFTAVNILVLKYPD